MRFPKRSILKYFHSAIAICCLALALTTASCGSHKTITKSDAPSPGGGVILSSATDMRVQLRKIIAEYGEWERLRVPVNINVESPRQISVSATALMERGKSLMLSLKVFGFEVGSLYLTESTIIIVDKMNKRYVEESVSDFCAGFPVTISNIQDLLLGHLFVAGENQPDIDRLLKSDFEIVGPSDWLLIPDKPAPDINYGFRFSPADVVMSLIVQTGNHQPVNIEYGSPTPTDFGPMATGVTVSYRTPKTDIKASLQWNFSKARWNNDVELREPAVKSDYKRISTADITKMISGL